MKSRESISVVVPAYNAGWCLARALKSVLAQSLLANEILVVNDGSRDDTVEVAAAYPVTVIDQSNQGLSAARNTGIAASSGSYVAFLDADDWWHPRKLEVQLKNMKQHPAWGFCSTRTEARDETGRVVSTWDCPIKRNSWLESIFLRNAAVAGSGSSVLVRKDILERAGGFDTRLQSLEDIDLWMRIAALSDYGCISEILTFISKRSASMSGNLFVMRDSALTVMKKNRSLLSKRDQGRFWHHCYAGVLLDYAAWQGREGYRLRAFMDIVAALAHAPLSRSRLAIGMAFGLLGDAARSGSQKVQ